MKTNKILVMALLLGFAGAGFTSCAIKDNEKKAEMVEDPIQATTEYYINGKVVDENGNNLSGVNVSAGEVVAKTAADGTFSLTVNETGSYNMAASMDGYLKVSGTVAVPQNATNRSSYNTSFIMTKKAASVTVDADNTTDVVINNGNKVNDMSEVKSGVAVAIPAATENIKGAEISVTEYVPEVSEEANQKQEAPVANIYVEAPENIPAEGVTLAIVNPVERGKSTFESFKVYKSTATRNSEGFNEIGNAVLDDKNNFSIQLTGGNLAGDYSFRVKYNSSSTTGKETVSGEKDNSGSMNAIRDYKISYTEKIGWEYTDETVFDDPEVEKLIKSAIKSAQGAEGVTSISKSLTTNISGNHILYYTVDNNYTETTYKFVMTGGKNVTVKTKAYTGTKLNYQIVSADQHSGGTASGN